jgi:hypothetical protein
MRIVILYEVGALVDKGTAILTVFASHSNRTYTLHRKSDLCIPEKKLRGLSLYNFHIHVSVSDLYIPTIGPPIFLQQNTRSWEYINRLPKHECRNWERGRTVLFLGIFVSNFRYSVFAV